MKNQVRLFLFIVAICILNLLYTWNAIERDLILSEGPITSNDAPTNPDDAASIDPDQLRAYTVLKNAGVRLTPEITSKLPKWSDIVSQYGPNPIMRNLDSACNEFRKVVPSKYRFAGVAGLFNTGTTLLGNLMVNNCQIDGHYQGTGMRIVVPWGKHNPPGTHRLKNVAKIGGEGINQTAVLPIVVIKDPYHWSVSQCRHQYITYWMRDKDRCPSIVHWKNKEPSAVVVNYSLESRKYDSLIEFWIEWYREYERAAFPAVLVRFEDLLFHAEEVVTKVCRCVGGRRRRGKFVHMEMSAKSGLKGHGGASGLVSAILRYGDPRAWLEGWTRDDWVYARNRLDPEMLGRYNYSWPEWPRR